MVGADLPVVQDNLLTEPLTSPPQQPQKKQGGPRPILLQPPISLLFDDPAEEKEGPKEPHIVSGRVAKTRSASCTVIAWSAVLRACCRSCVLAADPARLPLASQPVERAIM